MPRRIATSLLSSEPVTRFEKALYPEVFTGAPEEGSGPRSSSEKGAKMHQKVLEKYQDPEVVAKIDKEEPELQFKGYGTKGVNVKLMKKLKRKDLMQARKEKYQKMKSELRKIKKKPKRKMKLDKNLLLRPHKKKTGLMTKLRRMVKPTGKPSGKPSGKPTGKPSGKPKDAAIHIRIDLKGIKAVKAKCKVRKV